MSIEFTKMKQDKPNPNGSGRMLKIHIDGVWVFSAMQFDNKENGMRICSYQNKGVIQDLLDANDIAFNVDLLTLKSEVKIEVEEWE